MKRNILLVVFSLVTFGVGCSQTPTSSQVSCDFTRFQMYDFRIDKCVDLKAASGQDEAVLNSDDALSRDIRSGYLKDKMTLRFDGPLDDQGYRQGISPSKLKELLAGDLDAKIDLIGFYLPTVDHTSIPISFNPGKEISLRNVDTGSFDALRAQFHMMGITELNGVNYSEALEAAFKNGSLEISSIEGDFDLKNLQKVYRAHYKEFASIEASQDGFERLYGDDFRNLIKSEYPELSK